MSVKVIRRTIIVAWIVLFTCMFAKICGGEWFNIVATNRGLITACNYIKDNPILNYIMLFIIYYTGLILYFLAILGKKWFTKNQFWITTSFLIIMWLIKLCITTFIPQYCKYINTALDLLTAFFFPLIFYKEKWYRCLLAIFLYFTFSVVIMYTKSLSLVSTIDNDILVTIIYSIDYYIMLFLYYLYSNLLRKEELKI